MKNILIKSFVPLLLVLIAVTGCEDPDAAPIVTFDSAGKGAYPRLTGESGNLLVNILTEADFNNSSYQYSVEFVDGTKGTRVTDFTLTIEYRPASGDDQGPNEFLSVPASSFTTNTMGNLGVENITVTGPDAAAAFGLSYADLSPGDEFRLAGSVTTENGTYTSGNSSATVQGAAFQGQFDFTMPAACPSSLDGTYSYSTTNIWCDGSSITGEVELTNTGGGVYEFDDWAFGAYTPCYGGGGASGDLNFTEVCEVVTFTGFTDSFGDTWTYVSSISGEEWTIQWSNTYGESATSVITFPGGVPFTLAQ